VGGVVGGIAGLALILGLSIFCWRSGLRRSHIAIAPVGNDDHPPVREGFTNLPPYEEVGGRLGPPVGIGGRVQYFEEDT
jgi:hypothetical protein